MHQLHCTMHVTPIQRNFLRIELPGDVLDERKNFKMMLNNYSAETIKNG